MGDLEVPASVSNVALLFKRTHNLVDEGVGNSVLNNSDIVTCSVLIISSTNFQRKKISIIA